MQLTVLAVADCPNAPVLEDRLAAVVGGQAGALVSSEMISSADEPARRGMHGSPTLLTASLVTPDGVSKATPARCAAATRSIRTASSSLAARSRPAGSPASPPRPS